MHLTHPACETGNARTYELAYNGVAQIIDTSDVSLIKNIFINLLKFRVIFQLQRQSFQI